MILPKVVNSHFYMKSSLSYCLPPPLRGPYKVTESSNLKSNVCLFLGTCESYILKCNFQTISS